MAKRKTQARFEQLLEMRKADDTDIFLLVAMFDYFDADERRERQKYLHPYKLEDFEAVFRTENDN